LHASGDIGPTVAVFVNPGRPRGTSVDDPSQRPLAMRQRSIEYDSLTPTYGQFLLGELLPFVAREHRVELTDDPTRRTVCGISSGGICAFNVAWHHTQQFQRVLSHCGSFTNIRGGHNYPYLVRTTPRKPIRVFLQSGANDAITLFGDWPLANQTMANALAYASYDYRFEYGTGGHSLRHGGALFADSLRWLWRSAVDPI
jgi:enterochelin esterase family protein